jgi:hypothetical protein
MSQRISLKLSVAELTVCRRIADARTVTGFLFSRLDREKRTVDSRNRP